MTAKEKGRGPPNLCMDMDMDMVDGYGQWICRHADMLTWCRYSWIQVLYGSVGIPIHEYQGSLMNTP